MSKLVNIKKKNTYFLCNIHVIITYMLIVMLIIRGILNVNTLLSLGGFVLCLMLMLQFKQIYNNHEKNNRLQGYRQFVSIEVKLYTHIR